MEVFINPRVVIILQSVSLSKYHIAHLQHIKCYMTVVSQ